MTDIQSAHDSSLLRAWETGWRRGMLNAMSGQGVLLVCRREVDLVRVASAACCHAA